MFPFFIAVLILSPPSARAHHPVSGAVTTEDGKPIANLVIYLESQDRRPAASEAKKHRVSQKGRKFDPEVLVISTGDTVQFLNDEDQNIDHNIYSLSETKTFDLGLGTRGSTLETNFDDDGVLNYYCSVHKRMEGRIVVVPTPFHQVLPQPGPFKFNSIPEGRWVLKAALLHPRYTFESVPVNVGPGGVDNLVLKIIRKK